MFDIGNGDGLPIAVWLALATFVSEDLACLTAGVLVAEGRLPFATASLACFLGITAGDLLVFGAGRAVGARILSWRIVQQWIGTEALHRSAIWLHRRGPMVVVVTRFTPGARLATYLVAGVLKADARRFLLWFGVASAVWTPLIVGLSAFAGEQAATVFTAAGNTVIVPALATAAAVLAALHLFRGMQRPLIRRRLYGSWRRVTRWEFWPPWVFYPPVVLYILVLMARYRSATLFTAANPGIPGGGFVGESKFDILQHLSKQPPCVARAVLLPESWSPERRFRAVKEFMTYADIEFPVVVKPDQGQRGSGVEIARTLAALRDRLADSGDLIVQEYVQGHEFGVFYYRYPDELRGRILSITEKRFPVLCGDGHSTLDELILNNDRAVCQLAVHRRTHENRLAQVLAAGEAVPLVEIGSHCRGSVFLDATHLLTPALEEAFDALAKQFRGFYFGRFDVRVPSREAFQNGRNLRVLELNGVTSEATHIYDPANGLTTAYRALFEQWRIAFRIGALNRAAGIQPTSFIELLKLVVEYRRVSRRRSARVVTVSPAAASNEAGVGA